MALEIIRRAGRDKRRRALFLCRCECGNELTLRSDKARKQQTCGQCGDSVSAPDPIPQPTTQAQPCASPARAPGVAAPEPGTVEAYKAEIASKELTIAKLEEQASELELIVQTEGIQPSDGQIEPPDRVWNRVTTMLAKLRREMAKLRKELTKLEAAKAAPVSAADAYRAKLEAARAAQGGKQ